ncbi:MAG: protein translocase SEC61 complex subunit gamma [archaeon]
MEFKPVEWFNSFVTDTQRILIVSKKPDTPTYINMIRVTALGLVILGVLGYVVELGTVLIKSAMV